jgi:hypothetical protein
VKNTFSLSLKNKIKKYLFLSIVQGRPQSMQLLDECAFMMITISISKNAMGPMLIDHMHVHDLLWSKLTNTVLKVFFFFFLNNSPGNVQTWSRLKIYRLFSFFRIFFFFFKWLKNRIDGIKSWNNLYEKMKKKFVL